MALMPSTLPPRTAATDSEGTAGKEPITAHIFALERQIHGLYESMPFGSHCINEDETYSSINAVELAWLGCRSEDLIGKRKLTDFLTPESRKKIEILGEAFRKQGLTDLELDLIGADGSLRHISLSHWGVQGTGGEIRSNRYVLFDLTRSRQFSELQQMGALAFDSMGAVAITDATGVILHVNKAFVGLTGYSEAEIKGQSMLMLSSGRHSRQVYEAMWQSMTDKGTWQGDIYDCRKDGSTFVAWMNVSPIRDDLGATSHYVASIVDVTASRALQEEISHHAFFDSLTDLPNRRLANDRISQALSHGRRNGTHGAVIFIDIDNFKALNDRYGHDAGDQLLKEVANRLTKCLREVDTASRLGGDEFVVLLSDLDQQLDVAEKQGGQIAEKIRVALAHPYVIATPADTRPIEYACTASMGVCVFNPMETDVDRIIGLADAAMYRAKVSGRNAVAF